MCTMKRLAHCTASRSLTCLQMPHTTLAAPDRPRQTWSRTTRSITPVARGYSVPRLVTRASPTSTWSRTISQPSRVPASQIPGRCKFWPARECGYYNVTTARTTSGEYTDRISRGFMNPSPSAISCRYRVQRLRHELPELAHISLSDKSTKFCQKQQIYNTL